jgi:hypothetical protein
MRRRGFSARHLSVVLAALVASAATLVADPAQAATGGALRGAGSGRCLDELPYRPGLLTLRR